MAIRKIIFWMHLAAGVVAGLIILVMSATGVALAFEKEIIAWAERDVRRVTPPADAKRLPLDELIGKVRAAQPEFRPTGVTILSAPDIAVLVNANRTNGYYVNPYTGAVQPQGARKMRAFMLTMVEWHRYIGRRDGQRPIGKSITGACNVAFCFLAVSGLYLWWPRQWTKSALRAVTLFNTSLRGKPRDWNWHNVIGFWCAPVLVVVTITAMPISYKSVTDTIYKVTKTTAPVNTPVQVPTPAPGVSPLSQAALLAVVQEQAPHWHSITMRLGDITKGASFAVKQRDGSPRFVAAQFTLNPYTAEVLRAETYADYNTGRRIRSWMRFLHTGEALGPVAQFIAGLASLGGVVLTYTGLALAWRRFLRRNDPKQNLSV
ncbi:MAG TPA: PepSY-associated TM helix domain-containing protein, partial [Methylomirabilota bacterium]|nr:PepSY-associated TM helix domain-containing protein [Methylomirabilota bacterium]